MTPLVSCICITADRREFIRGALRSYLAQDWITKELIVLDDGDDEVRDLCVWLPGCTYLRLATRQTIALKRNLACEAAAGEILVHWDDDDWSAATRITDQVGRLTPGKAVSGYHSMLFWDGERAYKYHGGADYSLGSALCYFKSFWLLNQFKEGRPGRDHEDNLFVQAARSEYAITSVDGGQMMVARIHERNTSKKDPALNPRQWIPQDRDQVPEEFFEAIA